jgi:gamma-glutamyltranspeptidase/glutathione hydrolase
MRLLTRRLLTLAAMALVAGSATAKPKVASGVAAQRLEPAAPGVVLSPHAIVVAANPLAVDAGVKVLKAGGSAADAAVAVQAVLGLVEPQSSGLGGGAYMTYYDAKTRTVTAYDGRETAPKAAGPDLFLGADGKPLAFMIALLSGRSTGAPGAVAMLALVHKEHGRKPWAGLFGDATRLATDGFIVSPRLAGFVSSPYPQAKQPDAVAYFTKADGTLVKAGDRLKNPAYAASLSAIAAQGPKGLLEGPIAAAIVARLHQGELSSAMTLADLAAYRPRKTKALCHPWRVYVVCVPPPESSGVSLLQALLMLEHTDIAVRGPTDPLGWERLSEAERLMYADRDRHVGDPAFVQVPVAGLLDPAYVAGRAALIGDVAAPEAPVAGKPPMAVAFGIDATREPGGTSHFVIVDAAGDVVSMTTTVESFFGSGRMVGGFFLNNQLTDFSFAPTQTDGTLAANAVAGGKRPRSSMTPLIVLDRQGRFVAAMGSPGGSSILAYVLKGMVGVFDWKLPMQGAFDLPNLVARGTSYSSEPERFAPGVVEGLKAHGVSFTTVAGENSGLHGVIRRLGGYEGAADSRREGVARGF